MKSILVTGGAGYIGSHTCKQLAREGYNPIVFDDFSTGNRWAVKWGPLVEGDLADQRLVRKTIERYRVEAVIHFAARALVGESMTHPYKYLHDNVAPSLALLETMRESGVKSIVFSSTCATYGFPPEVPISEALLPSPINPYGESKLFIERALHWYQQIHGFSWIALRYFNAAGADPEGEIGECHVPETHLIPNVVDAALRLKPPVQILGTDYPTPDGTAVRDYIHVNDLADAHIRGVRHLEAGGGSMPINLGTGRGHSVREVVAAVQRASGEKVPVRESGRRPGDPAVLIADNRRAGEVLSWVPQYTDLDEIVDTAFTWHVRQRVAAAAAS
jgi:UDP-arabinose 4-epimerase